MCGFFPFSSLSCSQPCLQLHFGVASLHVGNGELPLRSCPRTTAPGAKVQPAHGIWATCGIDAVEVAGWAAGLAVGCAGEGAAGEPKFPAAGNRASRGWGRSWCHWVDLGPTHTHAQPHRGHVGDDCHFPLVHCSWSTTSLLLSEVLWLVTCCIQLWERFGMRLVGFRKVSVFWYSDPSPVAVFPYYFVF